MKFYLPLQAPVKNTENNCSSVRRCILACTYPPIYAPSASIQLLTCEGFWPPSLPIQTLKPKFHPCMLFCMYVCMSSLWNLNSFCSTFGHFFYIAMPSKKSVTFGHSQWTFQKMHACSCSWYQIQTNDFLDMYHATSFPVLKYIHDDAPRFILSWPFFHTIKMRAIKRHRFAIK